MADRYTIEELEELTPEALGVLLYQSIANFNKPDIDYIKKIIQAGAPLDWKTTGVFGKMTALHAISWVKEMDAARLLIEAGADVNAKDDFGCTPLHRAANSRNVGLIQILLEAGADNNAKNNDSYIPLDFVSPAFSLRVPKLNPNYNG